MGHRADRGGSGPAPSDACASWPCRASSCLLPPRERASSGSQCARPSQGRQHRGVSAPPCSLPYASTLSRARSSEPPRNTKSASEAARTKARRRQTADSTAGGNGDRSGQGTASKAEIKRALAALAGENDRIEAALSGDMGPGSGSGEVVWPSSGRITARFGRGLGRLHAGIDIGVPTGTPVHAADSGRVVISGVMGGYGKYVCIQHTGTLSTCYAHNSRLRVTEGESVDSGDVISRSGCTGRCYGDHLHFEVRDRGRGRGGQPEGVPRTAPRWSPCVGRVALTPICE